MIETLRLLQKWQPFIPLEMKLCPSKHSSPRTWGGVLTMGGEVRVGPSQTGGFFGIGAKDDGGVVVGTNGRIVQSGSVGAGVIHEVDNIISPEILWRYIDQLRIPGTG